MKEKKVYIWKKKRKPLLLISSIFSGVIGVFLTYLSIKVMEFDPFMQSGFTDFDYFFGAGFGTITCIVAIFLFVFYFIESEDVKVEVFSE